MPAFHEFLLGTINGRVQLQVQGPIPRAFMLYRKWNERSTGGVSRCPKECTIWVGSARQIRPSVRLASRIKSASSGIRQRLGLLHKSFFPSDLGVLGTFLWDFTYVCWNLNEILQLNASLEKRVAGRTLALVQSNEQLTRAEARLRESEERFSTAFRASLVLITISRLSDEKYVEANDAFVFVRADGIIV